MMNMENLTPEKERALNQQLQELALLDFEYFCQLVGVDKKQAYICLERSKGKSLAQIGQKTGMSKQAVSQRAKKCKSSKKCQ